MDDQVNPDLDLAQYEDSEADGGVVEIATPEDEAPTNSETPDESTSRRNRAVTQGQRTPTPKPSVNLHDLPEFRDVQANYERQLAEERRQRAELQAQMEAREEQALQARYQALETAMNDAVDPTEQRRYVDELANLRAAKNFADWQKWAAHVHTRATEEGLNAAEFNPAVYSGPTGAAQFERDLASKKAARLQSELDTARKAADPANIAKLVQQQVAKALQAQGMNAVDTGAPATPVNAGNQYERDLALFQNGKMSRAEFLKRHAKD